MSIGSIGSAALNSLLQGAVKIQAIDRDATLSSEAKRRMTAEIEKANGSLLEGAKLSDEAASRSTLLASSAAPPTGVAANAPESATLPVPTPVVAEPHLAVRSEPMSRGMSIDKIG